MPGESVSWTHLSSDGASVLTPAAHGLRLLHHEAITTCLLFLPLLKSDDPSSFQKLLFENDGVIIPSDISRGFVTHNH
jgi:hypothetical protein